MRKSGTQEFDEKGPWSTIDFWAGKQPVTARLSRDFILRRKGPGPRSAFGSGNNRSWRGYHAISFCGKGDCDEGKGKDGDSDKGKGKDFYGKWESYGWISTNAYDWRGDGKDYNGGWQDRKGEWRDYDDNWKEHDEWRIKRSGWVVDRKDDDHSSGNRWRNDGWENKRDDEDRYEKRYHYDDYGDRNRKENWSDKYARTMTARTERRYDDCTYQDDQRWWRYKDDRAYDDERYNNYDDGRYNKYEDDRKCEDDGKYDCRRTHQRDEEEFRHDDRRPKECYERKPTWKSEPEREEHRREDAGRGRLQESEEEDEYCVPCRLL